MSKTEGMMSMENARIRINKITLWDFKSVSYGVINLNCAESLRQEKSSIMGLYGQNATGKTVLIEALAIIKHIISGERIPPRYIESIASGKDECSVEVEISIINEKFNFDCSAIYKCTLSRRNDPNESDEKPKKIIAVTSESLRARGVAYGEKFILQDIARTDENDSLISPSEKCRILFSTEHKAHTELERQKILALYGSRSFIFSGQAVMAMHDTSAKREEQVVNWPFAVIAYLRMYALYQLFVIDERTDRPIFHFMARSGDFKGPLGIPILLPSDLGLPNELINLVSSLGIPKELIDIVKASLPHLNNVLSSIVSGLTLSCKSEKISLAEDDDKYRLELFSHREGLGEFPFRNESLGIKKIVSFIVLLIEAYNNPSFTLAIDEMDSGIFEYLLGEVLNIMNNSGKGQLIFTAHNLYPLEMLDARSVWFTTTDASSRYVQMNKRATNNLRNMYLRAIHLGHGDGELYNGTSKQAIAHAFRKMGRSE